MSRESADRIMGILMTKHAYKVILYISDHPGANKRDVIRNCNSRSEKTVIVRIEELIDAGLIHKEVSETRGHAHRLTLTPAGQLAAMNLEKIRTAMELME